MASRRLDNNNSTTSALLSINANNNIKKRGSSMPSKHEDVTSKMQCAGNMRPLRGGRSKEVRAVMPVVQLAGDSQDSQPCPPATFNRSHPLSDTDISTLVSSAKSKSVSLRDLCAEDKMRVANLIKELARLGQEKEIAEKNLEDERKRYEQQILSLVEQQEQILRDFEAQKKVLDYQTCILTLEHEMKQEDNKKNSSNQLIKGKILDVVDPRKAKSNKMSKLQQYPEEAEHVRQHGAGTIEEEGVDNCSTQAQASVLDVNNCSTQAQASVLDVNNCSTQAQASVLDVNNWSTEVQTSVLLASDHHWMRPFTRLIDRELTQQRQILELVTQRVRGVSDESSHQRVIGGRGDSNHQRVIGGRGDSNHQRVSRPHVDFNAPVAAQAMSMTNGSTQEPIVRVADSDLITPGDPELNLPVDIQKNMSQLANFCQTVPADKKEIMTRFMQSQAEGEGPDVPPLLGGPVGEKTNSARTLSVVADPVLHWRIATSQDLNQANFHRYKSHRPHKRRPPPPRYGPLQAPVMSSTQKSSEFGDNLSVISATLGDHKKQVTSADFLRVADSGDARHCCQQDHNMRRLEEGVQDHKMRLLEKRVQKQLCQEERQQSEASIQQQDKQPTSHTDCVAECLFKCQQMSVLRSEQELATQDQELANQSHEQGIKKHKLTQLQHPPHGTPDVSPTTREDLGHGTVMEQPPLSHEVPPRTAGQHMPLSPRIAGQHVPLHVQHKASMAIQVCQLRKSKMESNEQRELSPLQDKVIEGVGGDSCTIYSKGRIDGVKKQLDYSIQSDSEEDAARVDDYHKAGKTLDTAMLTTSSPLTPAEPLGECGTSTSCDHKSSFRVPHQDVPGQSPQTELPGQLGHSALPGLEQEVDLSCDQEDSVLQLFQLRRVVQLQPRGTKSRQSQGGIRVTEDGQSEGGSRVTGAGQSQGGSRYELTQSAAPHRCHTSYPATPGDLQDVNLIESVQLIEEVHSIEGVQPIEDVHVIEALNGLTSPNCVRLVSVAPDEEESRILGDVFFLL